MDECALVSESPMAFNTCEGSPFAVAHAAPEETDRYSYSILISLTPHALPKQQFAKWDTA